MIYTSGRKVSIISIALALFVSCSPSYNPSEVQSDFSGFVNSNSDILKKELCEHWGGDTAFVQLLGVVPDTAYKRFRAFYDQQYPNGTYLQNGSEFTKVSMDEYFQDYPQEAPIFRIFLSRKDRVQGNKFSDAGFSRDMMTNGRNYKDRVDLGAVYDNSNYDYITRNYYILTAIYNDGDFWVFSSDTRFHDEYERFAETLFPMSLINTKTIIARFYATEDKVDISEVEKDLVWLNNFTEFSKAIALTRGDRCGCDNGDTTVTDIDGNLYKIIQIGGQCWFKENLKTTRFNNGDSINMAYFATNENIANVASDEVLMADALAPEMPEAANAPAPEVPEEINYETDSALYVMYNNDLKNKKEYGLLYNHAVVINQRNVCPLGWHIATEQDINDLIKPFGGDKAGHKLKEVGISHWVGEDNSTDESGFKSLPGGMCSKWTGFCDLGSKANYWFLFKSVGPKDYAPGFFSLNTTYYIDIEKNEIKNKFLSIRCVRDN